jgi:(R,R)-butanediol dehydrogenase/meso-butanediol dehydrogenase/diacetyl reductase
MKAAVWHGALDVRIDDLADPGEPAPGRALVEITRAAICGSDLAEYLHGPHAIPVGRAHPLTGRSAPLTLGHEYSGRVVAVGDHIGDLRPGDRVCGDSCLRCHTCFWCLRGEYNICSRGASVGLHADGAFAAFLDVPAYVLERVPESIPDAQAAIVEPLAVGLHSVRQGRLEPGDTAVVIGFGMIGAAAAIMARASGAGSVIVLERQPGRRALALELGAAAAIDPAREGLRREILARTAGIGADVVLDCTGRADTLTTAIELARRGGRIVVVGLPHDRSEVDPRRIVYFEREIIGALGYRFDHRRVMAMLEAGETELGLLTSEPIPLSDLVSAGFDRMVEDANAPLRILVAPGAH